MAEGFKSAAAAVDLPAIVPYQLRHSGLSWQKLHQRRGQVAIMRRGRWRSLASLSRYEKGGIVMKEYAKLPEALGQHLERCAASVQRVMLGECLPLRR